MSEISQRFLDLEAGTYCIVPCIANIEEKDTRFLLRVLVEPNGYFNIGKKIEVIQNFKEIKINDISVGKAKEMKKPNLARSTCPNSPYCQKSENPFEFANIFDLKCGSEVVTYDTKMWHAKCFICHNCKGDLSKKKQAIFLWKRNCFCSNCYVCEFCKKKSEKGFMNNNGKRTCRKCHLEKFATKCTKCLKPIEGKLTKKYIFSFQ